VKDFAGYFETRPEEVSHCATLIEVLDVNTAAVDFYGAPKEQLLKGIPQLLAEETHEALKRHLIAVAEGESRFESDIASRTFTGEICQTIFKWVVQPGYERTLERTLVSVVDVTERQRARDALRGSEERFRALIENSSDIIVLLDGDGSPLYVSPSAKVLSGYDFEDLVGKKAGDFCHPEDMAKAEGAGSQVIQNPHVSVPIQLRIRYADGSWHTVEVVARNLLQNPAVEGIVVNMRDITDRVRAEAELAQAEKLASLGVLAGGIAHQVRNPLSIIMACSELLLEAPDDAHLRSQSVEKIHAAILRASQVIENLLRFARPEGMPMTSLDIQHVLEEALALMAHHMSSHRVRLHEAFQADLPKVHGNPALLQQVFTNLILNACDAMPQGGTLTVTTRATEGNGVEIQFRDTGRGIPPEHLPHVFDPLFTTKPTGEGTGLGLSVSQGIIQRHKGTIEVRSEVDEGTTFTIRLPSVLDWT
jgi:PAS domain S-box-containing protein